MTQPRKFNTTTLEQVDDFRAMWGQDIEAEIVRELIDREIRRIDRTHPPSTSSP